MSISSSACFENSRKDGGKRTYVTDEFRDFLFYEHEVDLIDLPLYGIIEPKGKWTIEVVPKMDGKELFPPVSEHDMNHAKSTDS
jgi:hypothetical protein